MADASITARIGGDASGLVAALEQGKQAAGKFADDFGKVMERKLGFKDVFKGILQGIGIASVEQIAAKLTEPFREAAESAQKIELSTGRAADAVERMIKLRQSENEQLATAEKTMERISKLIETKKTEAPSKSYFGGLIQRGSALDVAFGFSRREDAARGQEIQDLTTQLQEKAADTQPLQDKAAIDKAMVERWAKTRKAGKIVKEKVAEVKDEEVKYVVEQIDGVDVLIKKIGDVATKHVVITASMRAELNLLNAQGEATAKHNLLLKDTIYLMGKAYGTSRDTAEFELQSDAALQDMIKKSKAEIAQIELDKGRGLTAGADAATGFLPQGIVQARLGTDIQRAQYQLDLREKLRRDTAMGGIENARKNFTGDSFQFDETYNRYVKDTQTTNDALQKQTDLLEKINNQLRGGIPTMNVPILNPGSR